ncbi:MAG: hypothetical protein UR73_C0001G0011 [candidate division WS6 bacterium GW2011_GWF1_35_23]|uniref:Uncharacterized protein n=1 Tax=candidate division WS6 bacterium GW2011_GWF1_35_23 TaxID=1619097 RepID=A0A0G0CQ82_9BACT|nr:MAG: hypothetical protein UR73_C0001G0011 [candidate division WS6 bacterium GW2011_GWF1_35_23]
MTDLIKRDDLIKIYNSKTVNPYISFERFKVNSGRTETKKLVVDDASTFNLTNWTTQYMDYKLPKGILSSIKFSVPFTITGSPTGAVWAPLTIISGIQLLDEGNKVIQDIDEYTLSQILFNMCSYDDQLKGTRQGICSTSTTGFTFRTCLPFGSNLGNNNRDNSFFERILPIKTNNTFKYRIYYKTSAAAIYTFTGGTTPAALPASAPVLTGEYIIFDNKEDENAIYEFYKVNPYNFLSAITNKKSVTFTSTTDTQQDLQLSNSIVNEAIAGFIYSFVLTSNLNLTTGVGYFTTQSGIYDSTNRVINPIISSFDVELDMNSRDLFPYNAYTYLQFNGVGSVFEIDQCGVSRLDTSDPHLILNSIAGVTAATYTMYCGTLLMRAMFIKY